jgi:hypothetical protein
MLFGFIGISRFYLDIDKTKPHIVFEIRSYKGKREAQPPTTVDPFLEYYMLFGFIGISRFYLDIDKTKPHIIFEIRSYKGEREEGVREGGIE